MPDSSISVMVRDPLSELTRKERRNLLAVSAIAWAIVKTGLVPTEISNLGITFTTKDRSALLFVLAVFVTYFLLAFVVYAIADWLAQTWAHRLALKAEGDEMAASWRTKINAPGTADMPALERMEKQLADHFEASTARLRRATTPIVAVRWMFEFALPIGAGIYAIRVLAAAW